MRRRARLALLAALSVTVLARLARAQPGLALVAPHRVRAPAARLDREASRRLEQTLDEAPVASVRDGISRSLAVTRAALHFGLAHPTSLTFHRAPREGNCVEYAHLFGVAFNVAAARHHLDARAWVVRSDALLLGRRVPLRAFANHDWVLIAARDGTRWYVDPTLEDSALGWNIAANVSGPVPLPR